MFGVIDIWFFWLVEVGRLLMLVGWVRVLLLLVSVVVVIWVIMKLELILLLVIRNGGNCDMCMFIISEMCCFDSELILVNVRVRLLVVIVIGLVWKLLLEIMLFLVVNISGLLDIVLVLIFSILVVWCIWVR